MLREPLARGAACLLETVADVRVEVTARQQLEPLRLEGAVVGLECQIGRSEMVTSRDDH